MRDWFLSERKIFRTRERKNASINITAKSVICSNLHFWNICSKKWIIFKQNVRSKVLLDIIIIIWIYWYWFNYARTLRGLEKEVFLCFLSVQPWYLLYLKLFSPSALLVLANILNVSKVISSFLSCLKSITALQKIIGRMCHCFTINF